MRNDTVIELKKPEVFAEDYDLTDCELGFSP
jgi:hypothetical protein